MNSSKRKRTPPVIFLILLAATVLAYIPAFRAGFIWDDDAYITHNPTMLDWSGLAANWFSFNRHYQYYPLVLTTFWVEHKMWALNPVGFHAVNILLQALNACMLFVLLRRLRVPGAWIAALIFAIHPVHVETVAWITERKNLLSMTFYLCSALVYLDWNGITSSNEKDNSPPSGDRWTRYSFALLLFAGALLSKTVTSSLPAAILLIIYWKRGQINRRDVVLLLPFFAVGLAMGLVTAWVEKHMIAAQGEEWTLTFLDKIILAGRALWFYTAKLFWPANLIFFYPRWKISWREVWQWAFPIGWLLLIALLWAFRRKIGRGPLVAVLFFTGTLFPALGFFNVYPMRYSYVADHFQYHASIGVIVLAAGCVGVALNRLNSNLTRANVIAGAILLLALAPLTWRQCGMYRDLETLWRTNIERNPSSFGANSNLAVLLDNLGRTEEAVPYAQAALKLRPSDPVMKHNVANMHFRLGDYDEAIRMSREVLEERSDLPESHNVLAMSLKALGDDVEAKQHFEAVLKLDAKNGTANREIGFDLIRQGKREEALPFLQKALEAQPRNAPLWVTTGDVFLALGEPDRAREAYSVALRLDPNDKDATSKLEQLTGATTAK